MLPLASLQYPKGHLFLLPGEHAEWPTYLGNCGMGLGIVLTPVLLILAASGLVTLLLAGIAHRRGQAVEWSAFRRIAWLSGFPLAFAAGFWVGILFIIPWSYRYSAQRAQPIITALAQYHHDHPEASHTILALNSLVPRYLPELPTPGTLGATPFRAGLGLVEFGYPHAPGVFPGYQLEYVPGSTVETIETHAADFPDWRIRYER